MFAKLLLATLFMLAIVSDNFCEHISDFSECGISDFEPNKGNVPKKDAIIGTNHIYMGQAIDDDNAFPWMASLKRLPEGDTFCTATIIGPRHILTAMHCVSGYISKAFDTEQIQILYGAVNVSKQIHKTAVDSIKIHPKAVFLEMQNVLRNKHYAQLVVHDLAIISVKTPIHFAPNVRPICLADLGGNNNSAGDHPKTNPSFIIAGWGWTVPRCLHSISHPKASDQLMHGKMRMENCQKFANHAKLANDSLETMLAAFSSFDLKDSICVVPEHGIVEPGDSGGPLLSKIGQNNWVQVGVASKSNCNSQHPHSVDGLHSSYAPIDCAWIAEATDGEVKCKSIAAGTDAHKSK